MLDSPEWTQLCAQLQQIVDRAFPRNRGMELRVDTSDGRRAKIPLPMVAVPMVVPCAPSGPMPIPASVEMNHAAEWEMEDADLTERQQEIMQVMREAGPGACLTMKEIARRVGCEPSSSFRGHLANLSNRFKKLRSTPQGYSAQ